jgi:release factor glutamine methyltransferase
VLIPRPETEDLVERALALLPPGGYAADLGTGSGAIALALADERPDVRVDATDLSGEALEVAAANALRCGLQDRIRLFAGDLWTALPAECAGSYDLVVCNPPYVEAAELPGLEPEVARWEPALALVAPEGWRALYARLAGGAGRWLRRGGWLVAEVGAGRSEEVAALFAEHGLGEIGIRADLAGIPRLVEGRARG